MDKDLGENIQHHIEILIAELLPELDEDIHAMKAELSASGLLRSGASIKRTMGLINEKVESYYDGVLSHIRSLPLSYSTSIEPELEELVSAGFQNLSKQSYERLMQICKFTGNEKLYERMLPEVEKVNLRTQERFRNGINAFVLKLSQLPQSSSRKGMSLIEGMEAISLLVIAFLCGLWANDTQGNYEPIIILFGVTVSLLEIYRRKSAKSTKQ